MLIHWSLNRMNYCLRCGLINWMVNLGSCMMILNNWQFIIPGAVVNRFFVVDIVVRINSISMMAMMRLLVVVRIGVMLMMM